MSASKVLGNGDLGHLSCGRKRFRTWLHHGTTERHHDLLIEARESALISGDQFGIEGSLTVARNPNVELRCLGDRFLVRIAVDARTTFRGRCQSNGRPSVCDIATPDPCAYQAMSARHSASAAERLCL